MNIEETKSSHNSCCSPSTSVIDSQGGEVQMETRRPTFQALHLIIYFLSVTAVFNYVHFDVFSKKLYIVMKPHRMRSVQKLTVQDVICGCADFKRTKKP
jgi:hypothetical protein